MTLQEEYDALNAEEQTALRLSLHGVPGDQIKSPLRDNINAGVLRDLLFLRSFLSGQDPPYSAE